MTNSRWQDVVNFVLGSALAVSPWLVGYASNQPAMWNALAVGAVIAAVSWLDLAMPAAWEEWLNLVLALWLVSSPFVLGFSTADAAAWTAILTGVLIALFAVWALFNDPIARWWHEHVGGH